MQLYEKAADGDMKNLELAAYYQEQLETHDFYSIDTAVSYTHLDVYKRQGQGRYRASRYAIATWFCRKRIADRVWLSHAALCAPCLLYTSRCV